MCPIPTSLARSGAGCSPDALAPSASVWRVRSTVEVVTILELKPEGAWLELEVTLRQLRPKVGVVDVVK